MKGKGEGTKQMFDDYVANEVKISQDNAIKVAEDKLRKDHKESGNTSTLSIPDRNALLSIADEMGVDYATLEQFGENPYAE